MNCQEHDAYLEDAFANGQCGAYAIAAARALLAAGRDNVGISILIDEDGEPNTDDDRCVIHAYASAGPEDYDVEGRVEPNEMADRYDLISWDTDGPFEEKDFVSFFCHEDALDVDLSWIETAAEWIARHPDRLSAHKVLSTSDATGR